MYCYLYILGLKQFENIKNNNKIIAENYFRQFLKMDYVIYYSSAVKKKNSLRTQVNRILFTRKIDFEF